jgi:hypothetical protein
MNETAAALHELGVHDDTLPAVERSALDEQGYLVLPGLFDAGLVGSMRAVVAAGLARARQDPTWHPGGTLHVDDLLDAGPVADRVWTAVPLLAAVAHVLGSDFQLNRMHYRAPQPGHGAQLLHPDWAQRTPMSRPAIATAIVALVDFTEHNGATRLVPGSHRVWGFTASKKPDTPHPDERLVTMPAGSVLIFNGHLWHSGTRNRSTGSRDALQLSFSRRGSVPGPPPAVGNATLDRLGPAALLLL